MKNCLLLLALTILTSALVLAGDPSGRWQGKLLTDGGEMPGYLVLIQNGRQLTGTAGPDANKQIKLQTGTVDGEQVIVETKPGDAVLRFVLRLKDDKLAGDVFEDGNKIGTAIFLRAKE